MKIPLRRFFLPGIFLWFGRGIPARADLSYPVRLEKYSEEIRRDPSNYLERVQRAFLILDQGKTDDPCGEDIDTLLSQPRWRAEGERLQAKRLYLSGRLDEAKALIQKNILGKVYVVEQARLLADLELSGHSKKDTAAALAAYRLAWEQGRDEDDYVDMLNLYMARGEAPGDLLSQGPKLYPRSPGAIETVFDVYFTVSGRTNLLKCLALSDSAQKVWWPASVDWKVRNAKVFLALRRPREAEPVLLQALELMDNDPRMQNGAEIAAMLRKDIFTLLEAARKDLDKKPLK